jgi:hypothetical protein
MDEQQPRAAKRRDFLRLIGLGGVAGTATLTAGKVPSADAEPAKPSTGYRETAHVKKFYDSAKF